ncbi:MAG: hypothetical protein ACJ8AD_21250 [Gemmatimonadaceae bacterium]
MKQSIAAVAGLLLLASACKEPLNAPTEDQLLAGSAQPVQNLVTGVLAQDRSATSAFSYLLYPEGLARNALRPDPNEPRYVADLIAQAMDPSAFIGSSGWNGYYTTIRAANQFLASPSTAAVVDAGDRNAMIGLTQTIKALSYLRLLQLRDTLGVVIQTDAINTPDPIRTKTSVLAFVSALLDSAYSNLTAAGVSATMPVTMPAGYKVNGDFTQTANLAKFNRGLKGEVEVYRALNHQNPCAACAGTAITALNLALAGVPQTAAGLAFGPYFEYNPSAPESFNYPLADPRIYVTDNWVQSAQSGDARLGKVSASAKGSVQNGGLADSLIYKSSLTLSTNTTRPLPIRRAALWYMLRAQAEAAAGQFAQSSADVSVVHQIEGGFAAPVAFATQAAAQAAILYEYRYSFLFEGPYYLVALREYSALTKAYVSQPGMPKIVTDPTHNTDPLQTVLSMPQNESVARNGNVTPVP